MSSRDEGLGALLRALTAGPVAIDEAGALLDAPTTERSHLYQKVARYRRRLKSIGFLVTLKDGVLTLEGGDTLRALQTRTTQETAP